MNMHILYNSQADCQSLFIVVKYDQGSSVIQNIFAYDAICVRSEGFSMPGTAASADLVACNCAALRKAARRVSLVYDRYLARSGLTIGQYAILAEIERRAERDRPTLSGLAQALVMDRTGLSHTLKPLERDGLIRLESDQRDRRALLRIVTDLDFGETPRSPLVSNFD